MKQWLKRIILLAALAALGYWGWSLLFPNPEKVIRKQLKALAREVSFGPNQGLVSTAWKATSLSTFFTTNVEVVIDVPGSEQNIRGLDTLKGAALYARQTLRSLQIELPDINVTVQPGSETATVNLTARGVAISRNDHREDYIQELRLCLIKVKGEWLVREIVTVRTLS